MQARQFISVNPQSLVGDCVLETICNNSVEYAELPEVIMYNDVCFGKINWNSETKVAYYLDAFRIAFPN